MPKAKPKPPPEEQAKQFEEAVKKLINAGELSPTEAEATLDRLVRKAKG